MIKAFLFDMDGVLADTEDLSITIGVEYFSSIGIKASRADFEPNLGAGERAFFDRTALSLGVLGNSRYSYEDASAFFRARYPELLARIDSALPGAAEAVRNARRSGIMTSVASSAPAWKVHENIKAIGLCADDFDFIATGEDIRRNKPEKDIYELCLIKLGVDGSEAVVFEDSVSGITSGKRAGCRVVALMTTIDGESAAKAGADAVISDLSALPRFSGAEEAEGAIFALSSEEKKAFRCLHAGEGEEGGSRSAGECLCALLRIQGRGRGAFRIFRQDIRGMQCGELILWRDDLRGAQRDNYRDLGRGRYRDRHSCRLLR